ncbi:glycosyltransferase [Amycolatopsis cihanbeyliensis]|uniref:Teichuronic acid biosynthesis glycosyltransferase TuaH n=1 Tax=Amycolatopsis cihanbeyliensis TaxID=1128664 RepID=A0A542DFJ7_AMYCI|nr:glycosyltransferase [Amycolatopsis cihanbeyliensis]TQJ01829.1 teichuronic acid biosynthesis glycosyltransferase TuaH [Amycolatopsis cihanbeyliensis]
MNKPLFVVVSGVTWDGVKGSERQLTEALRTHADVLWVDPPVSPATPARYRGVAGSGRKWRPRLARTGERVLRLTPVALPGLTRPGIRATTWPLVRAQLRWALRLVGRTPHAVLGCSPHDVLGRWGHGVVNVLYGTDDWVAGAELMRLDPARVAAEERAALRRADLVLAVTPELAGRWRELGADPVLFPNGCDPRVYAEIERRTPVPLPPGFPEPVAGLSGQLSDRIDLALLEAVADRGIGLLLAGPRDPGWQPERVDALLARDNVHHTGPLPHAELLDVLARFDVGLTPYADTRFNRASFPLKTLEYLAAGKPVVSTALPAGTRLREETDQVWLAAGPAEFATAVVEAATVVTPGAVAQRRAVARRYSWVTRAAELRELTAAARSACA